MSSCIINKREARSSIFAALELLRPALKDKLTRISADVYDELELKVRAEIRKLISNHPSVGKTISFSDKQRGGGNDQM